MVVLVLAVAVVAADITVLVVAPSAAAAILRDLEFKLSQE